MSVSGCIGCIEPTSCSLSGTDCHAAPAGMVPKGATSKKSLSPWRVEFVVPGARSAYPERGLIVVRHRGATIVDWALVEVTVPEADAALAQSMLASFAFA